MINFLSSLAGGVELPTDPIFKEAMILLDRQEWILCYRYPVYFTSSLRILHVYG